MAHLSPYASSHDRAVELFYILKGGRVDYGEEHSHRFGHLRFGHSFKAQLPDWNEENPIILIAHSHGGNTARMLQHLLATQFFDGYETSAAWVKAVICVASPLNGIPVLHGLGMPLREECVGGCCENGVDRGQEVGRFPSLLRIGQTAGYLLHWGLGDFHWARQLYDWGLDHWSLTRRSSDVSTLWQLVGGTHHILNTDDTAGYDLTVHGACRLNRLFSLHSCTYYFSLPCSLTDINKSPPLPRPTSAFFLVLLGALTATITPRRPPASFLKSWDPSEWLQNDGVVPLRSQCYPCDGAAKDFVVQTHADIWHEQANLQRGAWHVLPVSEVDHFNAVFWPPNIRSKVQAIMSILD